MSQNPAPPPRQPAHIWDKKYSDFSRAQHAEAKAIGEQIATQPVTLSTLGADVAARVDQMVRNQDAMAETRYKEVVAERDVLEARVTELLAEQTKADDEQAKLKKAMTVKGIKLPL